MIGPEHDSVQDHYRKHPTQRISVEFAVQEKPLGTANAVAGAESFVGRSPESDFVVINGDNLYPVSALEALRWLDGPGLIGFAPEALVEHGNIPIERIRAFSVVEVNPQGFLARIIEKPTAEQVADLGGSPLVSMNCWRLPPSIPSDCRNIESSPRGEFELPDAIERAMDRGESFKVVRSTEGVLDLSQRADIAEISRRLIDRQAAP